jgi:hypothetical protein
MFSFARPRREFNRAESWLDWQPAPVHVIPRAFHLALALSLMKREERHRVEI